MLSKCANPSCSAKFRYLHQGKLFLLRSGTNEDITSSRVDFAGCVQHLHYAWLCDKCIRRFEVVLDCDDKIKVRARYDLRGTCAVVGFTLGVHAFSAAGFLGT